MAERKRLKRRLVLPKRIDSWWLTMLQQRQAKTGGRLIKHARYYWLLPAESHLTRRPFGSMVLRMGARAVAKGQTLAMDAAKSGGQEVMAGEALVECAEKAGFPGFGFFGQGYNPALKGEDGSRRRECNAQDRRMAIWSILNQTWEIKK